MAAHQWDCSDMPGNNDIQCRGSIWFGSGCMRCGRCLEEVLQLLQAAVIQNGGQLVISKESFGQTHFHGLTSTLDHCGDIVLNISQDISHKEHADLAARIKRLVCRSFDMPEQETPKHGT